MNNEERCCGFKTCIKDSDCLAEILIALTAGFLVGLIAGFAISPVKHGIAIGSSNTCNIETSLAPPPPDDKPRHGILRRFRA